MMLPAAALSQHIAILGKTGSGKTVTAKGIAEYLLSMNERVGVIDPTSAWWGLRSSKDGKHPGFPILVLGGDHGDLPLPALGGAAVANLLNDGVNLIADTSLLTVGESTRWFIEFAGTLYKVNRAPLHLFIDEAHTFAPQGKVPDPDTGKMLHAANRLASGGRSRGIRLTMITQRPQKLHKDALTSADTLIAMRVLAPQDRSAVEDWIKGCGDMAAGKEVLNSLASLKRGEGWAWYPEGHFLKRLQFPLMTTFDSSATPTGGGTLPAPKTLAEIDLTEIRAALADAVKEAEANDPKKLRARIVELERAASKSRDVLLVPDKASLEVEYRRGHKDGVEAVGHRVKAVQRAIHNTQSALVAASELASLAMSDLEPLKTYSAPKQLSRVVAKPPESAKTAPANNGSLGNSGKRRMLVALAQNDAGLTSTKLSLLTGIAKKGGTWRTYLAELRSQGLAEGTSQIHITNAGLRALGDFDPLPTGQALIDYWRGRLGQSGKRAIFDVLVAAYPRAVAVGRVAEQTGIAIGGGTWRTYLAELRGLELVIGRGELRANEDLFA